MHTFFYSNISEFPGNLEGILDEGAYKATIQNMHKLGWKAELLGVPTQHFWRKTLISTL